MRLIANKLIDNPNLFQFTFIFFLNSWASSFLIRMTYSYSSLMMIMGAGQPVTHMRSTNSKRQPSNQFPTDKIKPRLHFVSHSRSCFTL